MSSFRGPGNSTTSTDSVPTSSPLYTHSHTPNQTAGHTGDPVGKPLASVSSLSVNFCS